MVKGSLSGNFEGALYEFEASEAIAAGDLVSMASGKAICAAATEPIIGTAVNAGGDGDMILVNCDPLQVIKMAATDLSAAYVGEHMDIEGTTGAQKADGSDHKTTTAQLTLIKFISATEGLFTIYERMV